MLGDKLKALREAKSWSQAHLADASGLNIRTVQRIEAGEPCSYETMLALAAALDVDVSELEPGARRWAARSGLSHARLATAALYALPAAMFVTVNVVRSALGLKEPYDLLARAGTNLISFRTFNLVSPFIFIGGTALAAAICLPGIVRVRTKIDRGVLSITGVELRAQRVAIALCAVSVLTTATLLIYVALEQLHTPLR